MLVHSGHPLGCDACGFAQRIHPLVTQKITELVSSGITDIAGVKRHLHFCVTKSVPKELHLPKPFVKGNPLSQTQDTTMGMVGQKTMVSILLDQMTTALRHF